MGIAASSSGDRHFFGRVVVALDVDYAFGHAGGHAIRGFKESVREGEKDERGDVSR